MSIAQNSLARNPRDDDGVRRVCQRTSKLCVLPKGLEWRDGSQKLSAPTRIFSRRSQSHFVALNRLAILALQQGRHEEALHRVEAALRVDPNAERALMNKGTILLGLGRHDDALATYRQVLLRNPDAPDAHFNIGNALMAVGKPAEAAISFSRVVSRPRQSGDRPKY
jgi:Flp pilus assembly protein TadD